MPNENATENRKGLPQHRLMLANSMLGCMQIALDPEAISVTSPVYFPEVLELARQLINTSVRRLEHEEIRRLLHR